MNKTQWKKAILSALRFCGILGLLMAPQSGRGVEAELVTAVAPEPKKEICGILEKVEGQVQILDATQQHLLPVLPKSVIPCGSWVSSRTGWAKIRHSLGAWIHLGASTYVQLVEVPKKQASDKGVLDHLIVYKGQIYIKAGDGVEELRVVSSTARVRISDGKAIFVFNRKEDRSQLIMLEASASIENRFVSSRKVIVHSGEASEMDLGLLRVVPSESRVVSLASLAPKFMDLQILGHDQEEAIVAIQVRKEKVVAEDLLDDGKSPILPGPLAAAGKDDPQTDPEGPVIQKMFNRKIAGESPIGKEAFRPQEVPDPSKKQILKQERLEKKRLIDELSHLQSE